MTGLQSEQLQIRPFMEGDAQRVFDFFQGLSDQTRYFFHPYAFTRAEAEELTGSDVSNPDTLRFMASLRTDHPEAMIGHVFFWDWSTKVPWLGIALRDDYQGLSIGTRLMEHAIDTAITNHKGGILLTTMKDNVRAQSLYKRCGFECIGEDPRGEYLFIRRF